MNGPRLVVAGAGSIGCFIGGSMALGGRDVTLLLRPRLAEAIGLHGMRITDLERRDRTVQPGDVGLSVDPASLGGADVVLVTVKSGDTEAMAGLIAAHAPADCMVVSLQNGVDNIPLLRERLPGRRVVAGMVPFNVAQTRPDGHPPRFHRSTGGRIAIEAGHGDLAALFAVEGLGCATHPDMAALAWSKLALNMNNALNALSGLPLKVQLSDRRWRRILAAQIAELVDVTRRAGIVLPAIEGVRPRSIPFILRLPDTLFRAVAAQMLAVDPQATSSMAEDLAAGRKTEIDFLQGAVSRLAREHGTTASISEAVTGLVRDTERTGRKWAADEVAARLKATVGPT